jgi:hypothetical protein
MSIVNGKNQAISQALIIAEYQHQGKWAISSL